MPEEPEVTALLALMLLHDSRRDARIGPGGELICWRTRTAASGTGARSRRESSWSGASHRALTRSWPPSPPSTRAPTPQATDWRRIAALYAVLARAAPSRVVELNRAVAVAMAEGPERGLALIERVEGLERYHLLHATRGDLLRRLGRDDEAARAYRRALEQSSQPAEREFLRGRLATLSRD
jgi:predicted RNA polymerase sigma factor